jgi:hypothetical protein
MISLLLCVCILKVMKIHVADPWFETPCSDVARYQRFGGKFCLKTESIISSQKLVSHSITSLLHSPEDLDLLHELNYILAPFVYICRGGDDSQLRTRKITSNNARFFALTRRHHDLNSELRAPVRFFCFAFVRRSTFACRIFFPSYSDFVIHSANELEVSK